MIFRCLSAKQCGAALAAGLLALALGACQPNKIPLPGERVIALQPGNASDAATDWLRRPHLFAGRTKLVVPQGGERARMLAVAFENARTELERSRATEAREEAGLEALAALLDLDALPEVIDCFDISNLQGTNVVASRVRFRSGHPDRAGYRRFKIRGVEGQDAVGIQIVAGTIAIVAARPRVAGRPVERVGGGVVRAGEPGRSAASDRLFALPRLDAGFAATRHRPASPLCRRPAPAGCRRTAAWRSPA